MNLFITLTIILSWQGNKQHIGIRMPFNLLTDDAKESFGNITAFLTAHNGKAIFFFFKKIHYYFHYFFYKDGNTLACNNLVIQS